MNSPFCPTPNYGHISHLNTVLGVQSQGIPENESVNTSSSQIAHFWHVQDGHLPKQYHIFLQRR
jgi:hypothetical protein